MIIEISSVDVLVSERVVFVLG